MFEQDFDNNGIFGYSKSKEKKRMDAILDSSTRNGNGAPVAEFNPDERLAGVGESVARVENLSNALSNTEERGAVHRNLAREAIAPTDTEQRRRRQFVLSQNIANDAVNDYYNRSVKPEFERQRNASEAEATNAYRQMAGVPGANAFSSLSTARNFVDPGKVINRTMERLDNNQLNRIAEAYARYGGLSPESYRDYVLTPNIRGRMEDDYVKRAMPANSLEYVARSAFDNSLTGKMTKLALGDYSHNNTQNKINEEAMRRYNPNKAEQFAGGVGGLLIDTGIFAGLGAASSKVVGNATSAISRNLTSRVLANNASRGLTGEAAKRIVDRTFVNTLGTRIAASGAAQGLTLGAYDATNCVVDDLLYGDVIDAGKAAGGFAKGFGTGMMLGAVGTPLKVKARGLTGGKKVAASAGVLSAESSVFTLGTEVEKLANDVDIEPIDLLNDFGESTATLLAMRMANWRPKGLLNKLNRDGRLKPELNFNAVERQEISQAGVNPDDFISSMEQILKHRYPSLHGNARRDFINNYEGLISNDALSASTKAKLLYIVENKLTSTPPVPVDFSVQEEVDGVLVNVKDNAGRNVERLSFATRDDADAFMEKNSGLLRRNRIASVEEKLQQSIDSENFFRQAGEYARETGTDVDVISNAMYKKAKRKPLDNREKQLIEDILYRSSYNDTELANVMSDIRNNVEQRHGLGRGALLSAIEKNSSECTDVENRALSEYEDIIREQSERMRAGVTDEMHAEARDIAHKYGFEDYDSDNIKDYEKAYKTSVDKRPERPNLDIASGYKAYYPLEYEQIRRNGIPYPNDGEASIPRRDARNPFPTLLHSHDQLARMTVKANETAKKLNTDVELIYDPHELNPNEDYYGQKLSAKGWHNSANDKITINLASNDNVEDAGFTVLHEYVGHKGLANLFGDHYIGFLDEMLSRATPELRRRIDHFGRLNGLRNEYEAMDEYLSIVAEKTDKTPTDRRMFERLKDFMNDALYRMRIPNIRDLDDRKIAMLMSQHRKALESNLPASKHRRNVFGSFRASGKNYDNSGLNASGESFRNPNAVLPENRFRFIGEKGFDNLVNAGQKGFDDATLSLARNYQDYGITRKKLKEWTGWELGADGYWRYEIGDNDVKMEYYPAKRMKQEHPRINYLYNKYDYGHLAATLGEKRAKEIVDTYEKMWKKYINDEPKFPDVLNDDVFFNAYPEYKKTKVVYRNLRNDYCLYDPSSDVLYVDYKSIGTNEMNKAVAAEMQKMIQISEGFGRAFPIREAVSKNIYDKVNEPFNAFNGMKFLRKIDPEDVEMQYARRENFKRRFGFDPSELPRDKTLADDYRFSILMGEPASQAGNVEMRNVKSRFDMSDYERATTMAEDTEDFHRMYQYTANNPKHLRRIMGPLDIIKKLDVWSLHPKLRDGEILYYDVDRDLDDLPN